VGIRALGVVLLTACYSPAAPDNVMCSPTGACPTGQQCYGGVCMSSAPPDDARPVDAIPDASPKDASTPDAPDPAFALSGPRWLMPCTGSATAAGSGSGAPALCPCANSFGHLTIGGTSAASWTVEARIRGLVELATYTGGSPEPGNAYLGGSADNTEVNIYALSIASPAQVIQLNNQTGSDASSGVVAVDYTVELSLAGGTAVTFVSNGQDGEQLANTGDVSVPGVTDPTQPYDGQFLRIDVISATLN
jgi:hypothetical protein